MEKIYSLLVAYNPDSVELNNAISRLKAQTDMVLVCNNSDYDVEFSDGKVRVFNFGENLGIAKAQSFGMEWAFENGADFVLQMDQDSLPSENMVDQLYTAFKSLTEQGCRVGLVGPQDYDKVTGDVNEARLNKGTIIPNTRYVNVDSTLSSGSLIPKAAFESVGSMLDELFIDVVDQEYCWRLRSKGFTIVKNNEARLAHRLGNGKIKIFNLLNVGVPTPFRHYYSVRNTIYLLRCSYAPLFWKITAIPKIVFKILVYPFFLDQGFLRLKFMLKGVRDGVLGNLGSMRK